MLGHRCGVRLSDPLTRFIFHPDPDIDVAILPFNQYMDQLVAEGGPPYLRAISPPQMLTTDAALELQSIEQVIILGYPDGLYDRHNLTPIARVGTTASPISLDYEGHPTFLVDAPVFPGSSGSPVFFLNQSQTNLSLLLLGIVAKVHVRGGTRNHAATPVRGRGGPGKASHLLDLGIVYKASTIDECMDAAFEANGIELVQPPDSDF